MHKWGVGLNLNIYRLLLCLTYLSRTIDTIVMHRDTARHLVLLVLTFLLVSVAPNGATTSQCTTSTTTSAVSLRRRRRAPPGRRSWRRRCPCPPPVL